MSRVFHPVLRKSVGLAFAAVAAAGLLVSSAAAQDQISFGLRPRYNGVPNAGSNLVFYNLPASGSNYAGPVDSSFDLTALVNGDGTETASAFGLIATVSGSGGVVFNPPAIVGDENNLGNSLNPSFPVNSSFDLRFANTGIQGGGTQEIDVIALEEIALQNNTIANGDGIASIPIQIAAGATGNFNVAFNLSTNYTGFVKTISANDTQFLTNPGAFPHVGGTIEVRESRKGDMNGDSSVNFADIGGFVAALSDTAGYQAQFPYLQVAYISDFDEDFSTNFADIGGFVAALSAGSPPAAVPEPSALALVITAGVVGTGFALARRFRAASAR